MEAPQQPEHRATSGPRSFEAALTEIGRAMDRAMDRAAEQAGVVRARDARQLDALQARIADLERKVHGLDGRFTKILEESFKESSPHTPTIEIQQRYDLADELKTLFPLIYRELDQIHTHAAGTRPDSEARARWTADFLNDLLGNGDQARMIESLRQCKPDGSAIKRINRLIEQIVELRQRAADLDPTHVFEFGCSSGLIDPAAQEAWMTCDPEGEIAFVVTPAYVVAPRVFLRQQVFTVSRRTEQG
jgi:hypothetical protein